MENQEKYRDRLWLVGILICIFFGGPLYHWLFERSDSPWPLRFGGASLSFCCLLFGFIAKEIFASIKEKKRKSREE